MAVSNSSDYQKDLSEVARLIQETWPTVEITTTVGYPGIGEDPIMKFEIRSGEKVLRCSHGFPTNTCRKATAIAEMISDEVGSTLKPPRPMPAPPVAVLNFNEPPPDTDPIPTAVAELMSGGLARQDPVRREAYLEMARRIVAMVRTMDGYGGDP